MAQKDFEYTGLTAQVLKKILEQAGGRAAYFQDPKSELRGQYFGTETAKGVLHLNLANTSRRELANTTAHEFIHFLGSRANKEYMKVKSTLDPSDLDHIVDQLKAHPGYQKMYEGAEYMLPEEAVAQKVGSVVGLKGKEGAAIRKALGKGMPIPPKVSRYDKLVKTLLRNKKTLLLGLMLLGGLGAVGMGKRQEEET